MPPTSRAHDTDREAARWRWHLSPFKPRNRGLLDADQRSHFGLGRASVFSECCDVHNKDAYMRIRMGWQMNLCVRGYAPSHYPVYGAAMDKAFGRRVYEIRLAAGLGQTEFGEIFDVSQSTVGRWERGSIPQSDTLHAIAEYAKITIRELLGGPAPFGEGQGISAEQLQRAILDAYPLPDGPPEKQASYLADTVLKILELPPNRATSPQTAPIGSGAGSSKAAPPRAPTRRT